MKRTRLAPPPHLSKSIPTKLASGADDIRRLIAQGWTIVEAHGEAIVDNQHNGASVDPPPTASKAIEAATTERRGRGRPRLHPKPLATSKP